MHRQTSFSMRYRFVALILVTLLAVPFPGLGVAWGQSEETVPQETVSEPEVIKPKTATETAEPDPATETAGSEPAAEPPTAEIKPVSGSEPSADAAAATAPAAQVDAPAATGPAALPGQPATEQPAAPATAGDEPPVEVKPTLAVLTPTAENLSPEQRTALKTRLLKELRRVDKFDVISPQETQQRLDSAGLEGGDCADAACAVQLGSALGADKAIVGAIVRVAEGQWPVNVMLVDVASGSVERTESVEHLGSFSGLHASPTGLPAERLRGL